MILPIAVIKWVLVATVGVGTIGNSLIIAVILTMRRCSTFYVYLCVLAVADLTALYVRSSRMYIELERPFEERNPLACRLFPFVAYTTMEFAVWTVCLLSFDRMLHIAWPLVAKRYCSPRQALLGLAGAVLVIAFLNSPTFWLLEVVGNSTILDQRNGKVVYNNTVACFVSRRHHFYAFHVHFWLHTVVYSLLPLVVITLTSFKIALSMCAAKPRRISAGEINSEDLRRKQLHKSIIILFPTSMVLMITTLPYSAIYIYGGLVYGHQKPFAHFHSVANFTALLSVANHAVNFLIYGLVGASFRTEIRKILTRIYLARKRSVRVQSHAPDCQPLQLNVSHRPQRRSPAGIQLHVTATSTGQLGPDKSAVTAAQRSNSEKVVSHTLLQLQHETGYQ